ATVLANINGRVINALTKEPIGVVSVVVKGSGQGTTTDSDGRFSLSNIPDDATIVVSSIGFATLEITVADLSEVVTNAPFTMNGGGFSRNADGIIVALVPTESRLVEIQVVGYGTSIRANVTQ